jgi:hypothetical protein
MLRLHYHKDKSSAIESISFNKICSVYCSFEEDYDLKFLSILLHICFKHSVFSLSCFSHIFTSPDIYMQREGKEVVEAVSSTKRNLTLQLLVLCLIRIPALMKQFWEMLTTHQALDPDPSTFSESPIRQGVMGRQQSPCIKRTQIRRIPAAGATCSFPGIIFLNFIAFQKRWREKGIATWTNYGEWDKGSVSSIANCMKAHLAERCGGFFHTLERWKVLLTW